MFTERSIRMLELQNVTIKMRSADRVLVESFSFALADSDKAVIIGEEGNGKSTLLQFIYDRELIEGYCDCTGTLRKDGKLGYPLGAWNQGRHSHQHPEARHAGDRR